MKYKDLFVNLTPDDRALKFLNHEPISYWNDTDGRTDGYWYKYIREYIERLIYGLVIAQFREPASDEVDLLIQKHRNFWVKELRASIGRYTNTDLVRIHRIGTLYLGH